VKVFSVFVLFLAGLAPTHADTTQTWDVTASCQANVSYPCFASSLNAVFTTELETGTFESTDNFNVFTGTEPVVIGISGTLDGMPMTFLPPSNPLFGWIEFGLPEGVCFAAGGSRYCALSDIDTVLLTPSANDNAYEFMNWSALGPLSPVPEPSTILLLTMPLLLGLSCWAQMSLRKLSAR